MSDPSPRRWISVGEIIGLGALVVSALGLWITWKSSQDNEPTRIVEQRSAVPLALRGAVDSDGRILTVTPADASHALESLRITVSGRSPIETGSDGRVRASDVETALRGHEKESKGVTHSVPVRIEARYVEMGKERRGGGAYVLRYRWEGGGLFGGRSLRLVSLSR